MSNKSKILKPSPSLNDHALTQAWHPHVDLSLHATISDISAGNFFTVPISYGMDIHKVKEDHVTGVEQLATSSKNAWEVGPDKNNASIVAMWKKTTPTWSNEKKRHIYGPTGSSRKQKGREGPP